MPLHENKLHTMC